MAAAKSLKLLEQQYFFLDENFNKLFAGCTTDDQRDQLRRDYVNSRDNYWESRDRAFADNDPHVVSLCAELKKAQDDIEQMLSKLKKFAATLQAVTSAVKLGSSLIMLGSTPV